ncbi:MAG: DUF262 domain-containing protein [Verrucomicrobia bacterium]|nr:DUF262 domain-containing protein [Verrucomicrobiota bacterium]
MPKEKLTEKQIEELYQSGDYRVAQERNDFLLPQVLDFVRGNKWINIRPEYQRRLVWDRAKKSRFVESLLMNVPVPPVFLFEWELNRYEVMDGQQRLNAIVEFYENRFALSGLEKWTVLHGRKYADCPPTIQRGLDRRRISAIVLLAESAPFGKGKEDIRRIVFQRLNTGGLSLKPQELRNSLYSGPFNDLLIELAGHRVFDELWDIPPYEEHMRGTHIAPALAENSLFRRMTDCEIVLRFFAFREKDRIRGSIRNILDRCMEKYRDLDKATKERWRTEFVGRLQTAKAIFGADTFRLEDGQGRKELSQPLYDAVMIAVDRLFAQKASLLREKRKIAATLRDHLKDEGFYELIVGRPNTAEAVKKRLDVVEKIFSQCI